MTSLKVMDDFKLIITLTVAWVDMDSLGHVNSSKYFTYFESARIAYFEKLSILDFFTNNNIAGVLATNECSYLKPLYYPDTLSVGAKVNEVSKKGITMEYFIDSSKSGLSAIGETSIVFFDFYTNRKTDIPNEIVDIIKNYEEL